MLLNQFSFKKMLNILYIVTNFEKLIVFIFWNFVQFSDKTHLNSMFPR
jgi:hypothetical protein